MLGISRRTAFVACASSLVFTHRVISDYLASAAEETTSLSQDRNELSFLEPPRGQGTQALHEGINLPTQVASTNEGDQVQAPARIQTYDGYSEEQRNPLAEEVPFKGENDGPIQFVESASSRNPFKAASARRHPEAPLKTAGETDEVLLEDTVPRSGSPRRLELFEGLSQLVQPFSAMSNLFGNTLSPHDRDQLETFARRVATSRERVYRDLLFITGGRFHGLDEFAMKQLVAKVGLENMSSDSAPSSAHLSTQELAVLEAARRNRAHVERIMSNYEREVSQHARTLRQELQVNGQHVVRGRVDSIVSDGLFKRHVLSVRRLQKGPNGRRLASLLQGPSLLETAGSLFRSIDPSHLNSSLNASLSGLGLHHMHLKNISSPGPLNGSPATSPLTVSGLRQALESIFSQPQEVAALSHQLSAFQQGVSTSTDGALGAFLSNEGLMPFLSVESTKRLLGALIGGEAIAPHDVSGWEDLGLSPAAAEGAASVMPFQMFLQKLALVAQEVDSDVGSLKSETKKRINSQGMSLLPEQAVQLETLLDRLVWGSLQASRRLQAMYTKAQEDQQQPQAEDLIQKQPQQQPQAEGAQLGEEQQQIPQEPQPDHMQQQGEGQQPPQLQEAQPENALQQYKLQQDPEGRHADRTQQDQQQQPPEGSEPDNANLQEQEQLEQPQPDSAQQQPEQLQPNSTQHQQAQKPQSGATHQQEQQQPQHPVPDVQQQKQQPAQGLSHAQQRRVPQPPPPLQLQLQQQQQQLPDAEDPSLSNFFAMLMTEEDLEELDGDEKMDSALQRVELLADAISVLLTEYERAVEHLQDLLDEQIDAADDIKEELKSQIKDLNSQVNKKKQQRQAEAAAAQAAASVARAFDEAMESLKASLEGLLKEEQEKEYVPGPVQNELAALAAKIEAAAQERLLQQRPVEALH